MYVLLQILMISTASLPSPGPRIVLEQRALKLVGVYILVQENNEIPRKLEVNLACALRTAEIRKVSSVHCALRVSHSGREHREEDPKHVRLHHGLKSHFIYNETEGLCVNTAESSIRTRFSFSSRYYETESRMLLQANKNGYQAWLVELEARLLRFFMSTLVRLIRFGVNTGLILQVNHNAV
ncbi:uncharacterized protein EDB91DRAFT_1337930 [Suillus paluster]|uniref:uncharacterized protein n=1 Tax=Suillus paluster TaxID=48578 RepID=UPI001B868D82|nr:uncharacterized protein EDB91DRAFT_1337930 [Suillus paluster]KAG1734263.1 hypothetical protein EDB91DRAFT_1337930 [Suillus paluster]